MIQELKLKFGHSQKLENLAINLTPITVFFGPNNSGKSRILIEIEKLSRGESIHPILIVDSKIKTWIYDKNRKGMP